MFPITAIKTSFPNIRITISCEGAPYPMEFFLAGISIPKHEELSPYIKEIRVQDIDYAEFEKVVNTFKRRYFPPTSFSDVVLVYKKHGTAYLIENFPTFHAALKFADCGHENKLELEMIQVPGSLSARKRPALESSTTPRPRRALPKPEYLEDNCWTFDG